MNVSYTYDSDRLWTKKTVGNVESEYYYSGGQLVYEKRGTEEFYYSYNAEGQLAVIRYVTGGNTYTYYPALNIRGDVEALYDDAGTLVVQYVYDSWGKIISVSDTSGRSIGTKNPFRYRGYYYDEESGLYYLGSRYYDPEVGRFVNADSQLNVKVGVLGYNMFAYCNNNPVIYSDQSGHSIILACIITFSVIGALAGGHIAAKVSKAKTGKVNGWAVAGGMVGGGTVCGLIGWGIGAVATAIGTAATGTATTAAAPVVQQVAEKASTALQPYYPPNDGFSGAVQRITLEAGTLIQRTGELVGQYIAPAGTPTQMLSLPYDKIGQPTTILQVQRSVEVFAGRVVPWFGQMGGGIQYKLDIPLNELINEGIIKIFGG